MSGSFAGAVSSRAFAGRPVPQSQQQMSPGSTDRIHRRVAQECIVRARTAIDLRLTWRPSRLALLFELAASVLYCRMQSLVQLPRPRLQPLIAAVPAEAVRGAGHRRGAAAGTERRAVCLHGWAPRVVAMPMMLVAPRPCRGLPQGGAMAAGHLTAGMRLVCPACAERSSEGWVWQAAESWRRSCRQGRRLQDRTLCGAACCCADVWPATKCEQMEAVAIYPSRCSRHTHACGSKRCVYVWGGGGTCKPAASAWRAYREQPEPVSETWRPDALLGGCRGPLASKTGCEAPEPQMQAMIVLVLVSGDSAGRANSSLEHEQQMMPHTMVAQSCSICRGRRFAMVHTALHRARCNRNSATLDL